MRLSASCIRCFKACPMRFYYQYVLGLVPAVEPDHFRVGTNYHFIQRIHSMKPGSPCMCVEDFDPARGVTTHRECVLCESTGVFPNDPMDAVVRYINKQYAEPPIGKTVDEWETERTILLYSLVGYKWWYEDAGYEVEHLERRFKMPLLSPITRAPLRANIVGIIDRIFAAEGNRFIHEYKSTSESLDPDSDLWGKLTLDTQTRMYTYAAKRLDLGMCGVLYDVWRKPKTRPKKLTQGESKKFMVDGIYMSESFNVEQTARSEKGPAMFKINGAFAEPILGAKEGTFAIRETPEMYGARLLLDIRDNPSKHFARKEIAHRQANIDAFQWELFHLYKTICAMKNNNSWWHDESQCNATFKCQYTDFCYTHKVVGEDEVPPGFKKIPTSM